jgi:pantoate--beta-alanine ligase
MKVIKEIREMQRTSNSLRKDGQVIGFVPTMGFFHDGHLNLIHESKNKSDVNVVSIFVNPTQFSPNEDFEKYPRNFERDEKLCREAGVDIIFYPSKENMYSSEHYTFVINEQLSNKLCGISRPEHFRGVTTIVAKLINIVKPDIVVFGQKDAQQGIIINRMFQDLNFDVNIIMIPTIREIDGLAMSSRNKYLSPQHRQDATIIYKSLTKAIKLIENGEHQSKIIIESIKNALQSVADLKIDYVSIVDMQNLEPVKSISKNTLIAVAVYFDSTRLIDNIIIN